MKHFWTLTRTGRLVGLALLTATALSACSSEDGLDGADGADPIIQTSEASAEDCEFGGTLIVTGLDTNGDGELSAEEILSSSVICNGAPGTDGAQGPVGPTGPSGQDGEDGEDGADGSFEILTEDPGENCAEGGLAFRSNLAEGEEQATSYFCNQSCEASDYLLDIGAANAPEIVYNGFDSATFPVTSDKSGFAVSPLFSTPGFEFDLSFDDTDGLIVSPIAGEGTLEIAVAFSDGCGYFVDVVRVENIQFGESTLFLAHFFPGAGSVDLNLAGTDEFVASFSFTDVLGPFSADSGAYSFDVLDGANVLGTSPELVFAPNTDYIVFAYAEDGDLAFGLREIDQTEPDEETYNARFTHLADGLGAINVALIGDLDQIAVFDLAFPDSTDFEAFVPSDDYVAVDSTGDLSPDFDFFQTEGLFQDGAIIDTFIFLDSDGRAFLTALDYVNGTVTTVPANVVETVFAMEEPFTITVPSGTDFVSGSGEIVVEDCAALLGVSVFVRTTTAPDSFAPAWRQEMALTLTSPDGSSVYFWDYEGGTTNNFDGFFPGDYQSTSSATGSLASFIGTPANGTWILDVDTEWSVTYAEVELHLLCAN